jgi:NAD(P)H-flavin reductase
MLYVPGIGEAAISISSAPHTPHLLRHTIRAVGGVTKAIAAGGRGMPLGLRGPFGSSWPMDSCLQSEGNCVVKKDVIIVAGGIGLAPLRSVIYALCQQREQVGRIVVLVGARTPDDLLFHHEYAFWRKQGVEVQATVDRANADWHGNIGVVTGLLNRLILPQPDATIVMTCGPEVMMRYVVQSALQRKIQPTNIWLSLERNMNCAVGLCGHCQLGPEFLCKDGPVLPYSRVAQWLKVQAL